MSSVTLKRLGLGLTINLMITYNFAVYFFIVIGLISCKDSESNRILSSDNLQKQTISKNVRPSLAGQIFLFAPELDSISINAIGACDCCSANVLFISDSTFVDLGYCESSTVFSKGFYTLDSEYLKLSYKELVVNKDYNLEKENDPINDKLVDYLYKTESIPNQSKSYKLEKIKNKIVFKNNEEFGTIDHERNFIEEIKKLKSEKVWAMLRM